MENKIIPMEIEGIDDRIYSTFWSRLGAYLLDVLISVPLIGLVLFINSLDKNIFFLTTIPSLLYIFWYWIYLPKRYGGTLGKLIIGLKIVKIDSSPIGWKEAFLRYIVDFGCAIINHVVRVITILLADNEIYKSLSWLNQLEYLSSIISVIYMTILYNIWILSGLITLLFNKRRRAIHDFIAGTVIVKSKYIEKIRNEMDELNNRTVTTSPPSGG